MVFMAAATTFMAWHFRRPNYSLLDILFHVVMCGTLWFLAVVMNYMLWYWKPE